MVGGSFAPAKDPLSADDAIAALVKAVAPVDGTETLPLFDCYGRVLADDLVALRTVPPAANSAVDGYGVRTADLSADETCLPVGGRIAAGHPFDRAIRAGEALRIFTGAPIPDGMDAVIPQENASAEGESVWLPSAPVGSNIRPAGEDIAAGSVILKAGKTLLPHDVGYAASAGHPVLTVRRRPRVALFATGDEVCEPGCDTGPASTVNSNMYTLFGLVRSVGCDPHYLGILPDDPDALKTALDQAAHSNIDAILTTGGVSIGEEDHVKAAVEALGSLHFWRIAIKPGRPLAFGRIHKAPFIGLPGNPVAAAVTFMIFARPLLQRLAGADDRPPQRIPILADFTYKKKPGRREWLRGTVAIDSQGRLTAHRFPNEGSGILTSLVVSTGLIELSEDQGPVAPGDTVTYIPFSELQG